MSKRYKWLLTLEQHMLLEKDNRKVITDKMQLPQEVAEWAHLVSDKYSVWIADSLKRQVMKDKPTLVPGTPEFDSAMKVAPVDYEEKYRYVLDWLKSPRRNQAQRLDFKTLTLEDAWKMSDDWHKSLKASGVILDENGEVFLTFDDGYYWIDLKKNKDEDEGEAMGHCATTGVENTLWSLRDSKKEPHVTVAYNPKLKTIDQIKGKQNTKPVEKYFPYILKLISTTDKNDPHYVEKFDYEYSPKDDFHVSDLSDEEFDKLIKAKPSLASDPLSRIKAFKRKLISLDDLNSSRIHREQKMFRFEDDGVVYPDQGGGDLVSLFDDEGTSQELIRAILGDGDSYEYFEGYEAIGDVKSYTDDISDENIDRINKWAIGKTYVDDDGNEVEITEENVEDIELDDMIDRNEFEDLLNAIEGAASEALRRGAEADAHKKLWREFESEGFRLKWGERGLDLTITYDHAEEFLKCAEEAEEEVGLEDFIGYWRDYTGDTLSFGYSDFYGYEKDDFNEALSEKLYEIER
jgi:hypothetical protein